MLETQCVARTENSAVDRPVKRGDGLFSYILDSPLCFFSYNVYFPPKDPFTSHIAQVQVQVKRGDGPTRGKVATIVVQLKATICCFGFIRN